MPGETSNLSIMAIRIRDSVGEMAAGSRQIQTAIDEVNEIAVQTKDSSDEVKRNLAGFVLDGDGKSAEFSDLPQ